MIADFVVVPFVSLVSFVSLSLSSLHSLNSLIDLHPVSNQPISCQKGSNLVSTLRSPDGLYLAYCSFGLQTERSQMTPYHKKLLHVEGANILTTYKYAVEHSSLSLNLGNRLYSLNNLVCKSYIANGDTLILTDNERLRKCE